MEGTLAGNLSPEVARETLSFRGQHRNILSSKFRAQLVHQEEGRHSQLHAFQFLNKIFI